jgi:sec-independent protein translocase protein TatC
MDERRMPFVEHLAELRSRLLRALLAVGVGTVLCFIFAKEIIDLLKLELLPASHYKLHTFTLGEAFFQEIKVAIIGGLFLAGPFFAYQIWAFVAPGLYERERRIVVPFALSAVGFFAAGAAFCFFVVLPFAIEFLLTYGIEHSEPVLQLAAFISFILFFLLAFGLIFELPVVLYFLAKVGVVKAAPLRRFRRYAIVAFFVIAAILTPTPDIFNQSLMAVPMWLLYELGILGVAREEKQRAAREAAARAAEAEARAEASPLVQAGEGGS